MASAAAAAAAANPCIPVPLVAGELGLELGVECPAKYAACTPQPLLQHWVEPGKAPDEGGSVRVGCTEKGLCIYAHFVDSHIFSCAQADQEKMWCVEPTAIGSRPDYAALAFGPATPCCWCWCRCW